MSTMVQISRISRNCFIYIYSELSKEFCRSLALVGVTPPQLLALYAPWYFFLNSPDSCLAFVIQCKEMLQSVIE